MQIAPWDLHPSARLVQGRFSQQGVCPAPSTTRHWQPSRLAAKGRASVARVLCVSLPKGYAAGLA
jgi:hypothetical protein